MKRGFQNQSHGSGQDPQRDRGWCSTTSDPLQGNWLCQERRWLVWWRHILTKILPHFNASKIWSIPFRQRKECNLHSTRVEIETFEFCKFASMRGKEKCSIFPTEIHGGIKYEIRIPHLFPQRYWGPDKRQLEERWRNNISANNKNCRFHQQRRRHKEVCSTHILSPKIKSAQQKWSTVVPFWIYKIFFSGRAGRGRSKHCMNKTMRFLKEGNRSDDINKDDRLYWDVLGWNWTANELYWAVMGCTGLHWAVLSFTGLYWAVLGCSGV